MVVAEDSFTRKMAYEKSEHEADNRFQLDQRFDDDSFEKQKKKQKPQNADRKQGKKFPENKVIVRYDPTLPEHKKFELKLGRDKKPIQRLSSAKAEKRKKKKKEKLSRVEAAPEPVSEQTFVKISEDLKGYFQKKEKGNEGFSILKLLNRNEPKVEDDSESEGPPSKQIKVEHSSAPDSGERTKPEVLNIERLDLKEGTKAAYHAEEQKYVPTDRRSNFDARKGKIFDPENGVWYDTLFLREGDVRLEEGIKWLNTKPEMPENWAKFKKEIYYDALHKREKSLKRLNSLKNPHQQRREHQLNKARKYIHKSIKMKRRK